MACRLAKAGYFGGNPSKVLRAPVDVVMDVMAFEAFEVNYEKAYEALNRKE